MTVSTNTLNNKPGLLTTQFWGKLIMQLVLMLNAMFDLGIDLSDDQALSVVAGMEVLYQLWRRHARLRTDAVVQGIAMKKANP